MQEENPRWRKTRRSTIGFFSVNSQIRKVRKPITAVMASTRISVEENQSLSLPSSSMICSAATQTINSSMPILSTGLMTARVLIALEQVPGDHTEEQAPWAR